MVRMQSLEIGSVPWFFFFFTVSSYAVNCEDKEKLSEFWGDRSSLTSLNTKICTSADMFQYRQVLVGNYRQKQWHRRFLKPNMLKYEENNYTAVLIRSLTCGLPVLCEINAVFQSSYWVG